MNVRWKLIFIVLLIIYMAQHVSAYGGGSYTKYGEKSTVVNTPTLRDVEKLGNFARWDLFEKEKFTTRSTTIEALNITDVYLIGREPYNITSILYNVGLDNILLYGIDNMPSHGYIFYSMFLNVNDANISGILYRNFTFVLLRIDYTATINRWRADPREVEIVYTRSILEKWDEQSAGVFLQPSINVLDIAFLQNGTLMIVYDLIHYKYNSTLAISLRNTTIYLAKISDVTNPVWEDVKIIGPYDGFITDMAICTHGNTFSMLYGNATYISSGTTLELVYTLGFLENLSQYDVDLSGPGYAYRLVSIGNIIYLDNDSIFDIIGSVLLDDMLKQEKLLALFGVAGSIDNREIYIRAVKDDKALESELGFKVNIRYPILGSIGMGNTCWYIFVAYADTEQMIVVLTVNYTVLTEFYLEVSEELHITLYNPTKLYILDNNTEDQSLNIIMLESGQLVGKMANIYLEYITGGNKTVYSGTNYISINDESIFDFVSSFNNFEDVVSVIIMKRGEVKNIYLEIAYVDYDADGLGTWEEKMFYDTDPFNDDYDGDGINDGAEVLLYNTSPKTLDSDGDGLDDKFEVELKPDIYYDTYNTTNRYKTDPCIYDTDGDGFSDGAEVMGNLDVNPMHYRTDPTCRDTDDDGLDDYIEIINGTQYWINSTSEMYTSFPNPTLYDSDDDGLSDGDECLYMTNPMDNDSDRDGINDFYEISFYGTYPQISDSDADGLLDGLEIQYGTNPNNVDSDDDGLIDGDEIYYGTNPLHADSDMDGISDGDEISMGTNPLSRDTDSDGLSDYYEIYVWKTNPCNLDTDGDDISDFDEVFGVYMESFGLVRTDPLTNDTDNDNLSDSDEIYVFFTNPTVKDTDGDGLGDYSELIVYETNATNMDTDNDTVSDYDEIMVYDTDPLLNDTDGDGLNDGLEVYGVYIGGIGMRKMDPLLNDTDGDGLSDYEEVSIYYTDPISSDPDNDGLNDTEEISHGFDPLDSDTDDDGLSDGEEMLSYGTDPLNPDTDGDGLSDYYELKEKGTDPLDSDTDGDMIPDNYDILFPTTPDYLFILFILAALIVYKMYTYGVFRDWKKDVVFYGLSDEGGVPLFIIPESKKLRADVNLVSSGLTGIIALASEISGKKLKTLTLSGEVPILIIKGKNSIAWIFTKREYPRIMKELTRLHGELEEKYGEDIATWGGFIEETIEISVWLSKKLGKKAPKKRTKTQNIDKLITDLDTEFGD